MWAHYLEGLDLLHHKMLHLTEKREFTWSIFEIFFFIRRTFMMEILQQREREMEEKEMERLSLHIGLIF